MKKNSRDFQSFGEMKRIISEVFMKYLLFEGGQNVGKTTAIIRFANSLINKHGYVCVNGNVPAIGSNKDFKAVLENANAKSGTKKIIVNSASDYLETLDECKSFADSNKPYDIIISSCRMEQNLYSYFFKIFSINNSTDKIFEIPMAKINHRNQVLKKHAMRWYKDKIDNLADFLFLQL